MEINEPLHPVPMFFFSFFALLVIAFGIGFAKTGVTALALSGLFFFALLGFFAWHGLPVRITLDDRGVSARSCPRSTWRGGDRRPLHRRSKASRAGSRSSSRTPPSGHRGGAVQISVPAVETCPQQALVLLVRERWLAAGERRDAEPHGRPPRDDTDLVTMGKAIGQLVRFEPVDPLRPPVPFRVEAVGEPSRVRVITDSDDPVASFPTL